MAQYIDKDALVAEIERRKEVNFKQSERFKHRKGSLISRVSEDVDILCFLDTLDVKEVDLEKEYEKYYEQERYIQTFKLAKHFFELGLKAAQKGK